MRYHFALPEGVLPSCHAATVTEAGDGLVAAFFAGTAEGANDVGIVVTRFRDGQWEAPRRVAEPSGGDGSWAACWNPVLHTARDGTLVLFYKVGPNCADWWGMILRSRDGGTTWSAPERIPDGHWGPIRNKAHRLPDGTLLCPSSTEIGTWKIHFEFCDDLGHGWSRTGRVADPLGLAPIQPTILDHGAGGLQALCRTQVAGVVAVTRSEDLGRTWSPLRETRLPNPNSSIDGLRLEDGRFLLALNPTGMVPGKWSGKRTPLVLVVGPDGTTWDGTTVLEDRPGEYSYPAVIQDAAGTVHVLYTHDRKGIRHVEVDPATLGADGPPPVLGGR